MKWLKNYFTFSNSDRNAVIILSVILFLLITGTKIIDHFGANEQFKINKTEIQAVQLSGNQKNVLPSNQKHYSDKPYNQTEVISGNDISNENETSLHTFNPNVFNENDWTQFGASTKLISTIQNYLTKGGYFKNADDLKKIYGLSDLLFIQVKPYLLFDTISNNSNKPILAYEKLDLNVADSAALDNLKGVGNYTASKIIRYRNLLGGYYSVDQLKEIRGIKPEYLEPVLNQVIVLSPVFTFIEINNVDAKTLSIHPYVSTNEANAIVAYRKQHGNFKTADDLKSIELLSDSLINKLTPYLKY